MKKTREGGDNMGYDCQECILAGYRLYDCKKCRWIEDGQESQSNDLDSSDYWDEDEWE